MSAEDVNEVAAPGGKVAGRIAKVVSDATVHTRQRMAGTTAGVAQKVMADFTNHVSDEIRGVLGPLWRRIAEDPETPEELRPVFTALGNERGQAWAWIGGTVTGAALGGGLMNLIANYLNPVILPMIAASPHGIVAPGEAAAAKVRGWDRGWDPERDARSAGINQERWAALMELQRPLPTVDELRAMLNRGDITGATFAEALRHYGYDAKYTSDLMNLRHADHSAPEIAAMWNRGILTTAQAVALGRRVGTDETQMKRLLELGGEPPATAELLFAWRRGVITESQVDRALRQGPLRFEWIDAIKALQWLPLSVTEAADAVNQGHMSLPDAQKVARENGVRDDDFTVIIENAGLPPGPQEALDWLNRGILTEAQFRAIFLESRLKNKYIDLYLKARHETMPPETIRLMFSRGAMDRTQALGRLQQRGYTAEDAAIVLDGASAEKTQVTRDLTTAQIRELYAERAISETDAVAMLRELGYEDDESTFILTLGDLARLRRFVSAATTRVRSSYVAGRIDEPTAVGLLDQLGIPVDQRDDMLILWDIERSTVSKGLTPSQVQQAFRRGLIGQDDAMSRLTGQGYGTEDATIMLTLALPASATEQ